MSDRRQLVLVLSSPVRGFMSAATVKNIMLMVNKEATLPQQTEICLEMCQTLVVVVVVACSGSSQDT